MTEGRSAQRPEEKAGGLNYWHHLKQRSLSRLSTLSRTPHHHTNSQTGAGATGGNLCILSQYVLIIENIFSNDHIILQTGEPQGNSKSTRKPNALELVFLFCTFYVFPNTSTLRQGSQAHKETAKALQLDLGRGFWHRRPSVPMQMCMCDNVLVQTVRYVCVAYICVIYAHMFCRSTWPWSRLPTHPPL